MQSMRRKCRAQNRRGEPCRSPPGASGWCWFHDPSRAKQRASARRRGGQRRRVPRVSGDQPPVEIGAPEDVLTVLNAVLRDVWILENCERRAGAIARLASLALTALEVGELERRLEAIESVLSQEEVHA